MKKVCFIAQFPPPMHGLSKAVDTLYRSELAQEFSFQAVNITNNRAIVANLWRVFRSDADLFYFTLCQSRGGNLRDLLIMKLLYLQGKKCVVHLHGGYYRQLIEQDMPRWQRNANVRAIGRLAGAIALGESLQSNFTGLLSDDKIHIVRNCVDDEYLMSDESFARKLAAFDQRAVRHVLFLSNFMRIKGYPAVLEMARLEKQHCEAGNPRRFHFDFAGKFFEKAEEDFFFGFVREHALEEYITFHGVVGGDEKRRLLEKSDIFVLLTTHPTEGQPISILEAMGNGMSVVTTDYPGILDVVSDGENGLVVSRKGFDISYCYENLSAVVSREIALRNRQKILEHHSQRQYIDHMRRCFREIGS